jgi:ribosomal protein S18 acetylase RimI-like enzyme
MMTIRPANIEDLEGVLAIVRKATRRMDNLGIPQWDDIYPNRSILQTDIEHQHMQVIESEGSIAGFTTLSEEQPPEYSAVSWLYPGRILVVHRLTIAPEHQGKNFASRLMDSAEEEAASRGYDAIRLDAFTQNPVAMSLYERRGYRKAGTVRFRKGIFFCYEKKLNRGQKTEGSNNQLHTYG